MMKTLNDWIMSLPEGNEKDYHSKLFEIVKDFKIDPENLELGFALIYFLERCDIEAYEFNTVSHPAAGSLLENSIFVSKIFYRVNYDALKWKNEFLIIQDDTPYLELIYWWRIQFQNSDKVMKVVC